MKENEGEKGRKENRVATYKSSLVPDNQRKFLCREKKDKSRFITVIHPYIENNVYCHKEIYI